MAGSTTEKKLPRSKELSTEQMARIKEVYDAANTATDAALQLGMLPETLERILKFGSCSGKTYVKLFGEIKDSVPSEG